MIDNEIYKNYRLTYHNYVAADIYFNTNEYQKYYSSEQKSLFNEYLKDSLNQIQGEYDIIKDMFLKIYAMPVKNYFDRKEL